MTVAHEREFQLHVKTGIGYIRPCETLAPAMAQAIRGDVQTYIRHTGPLHGLLLDVREFEDLSIVQLSALVDAIGEIGLPLAVVVGDETQHRLANLLLRTLPNQQHIAYMITLEGAYSYLNARSTGPLM